MGKVGKSWVVGGVCAFALTASFALATPSVLGDSSVPDVSANNVQSASDNTTDTQQNTTVTEENDKVQSAATNDNVTTAASDTTQSADNNVTEKQSDDHALDNEKVDNKQDEVAQTNVTSKNEESAVASTDTDPAGTTTDETQQVSGKYVEKDGSWYYYFDDGKNAKGLSTIFNILTRVVNKSKDSMSQLIIKHIILISTQVMS